MLSVPECSQPSLKGAEANCRPQASGGKRRSEFVEPEVAGMEARGLSGRLQVIAFRSSKKFSFGLQPEVGKASGHGSGIIERASLYPFSGSRRGDAGAHRFPAIMIPRTTGR